MANAFTFAPYFLLFRNISALEYAELDACERGEYKPLADLDDREKSAWMDSIRLDKPWEGREEFFQTHWQRLNALVRNPWLQADTLVKNLQAYAAEGVTYVEYQIGDGPYEGPDGELIDAAQAFDILRKTLARKDVQDLGVTDVLVGHSERRHVIGEGDDLLNRKALAALDAGLNVTFCIGETLEQREAGLTDDFVAGQVTAALVGVDSASGACCAFAYEPIWAIGTLGAVVPLIRTVPPMSSSSHS